MNVLENASNKIHSGAYLQARLSIFAHVRKKMILCDGISSQQLCTPTLKCNKNSIFYHFRLKTNFSCLWLTFTRVLFAVLSERRAN